MKIEMLNNIHLTEVTHEIKLKLDSRKGVKLFQLF